MVTEILAVETHTHKGHRYSDSDTGSRNTHIGNKYGDRDTGSRNKYTQRSQI